LARARAARNGLAASREMAMAVRAWSSYRASERNDVGEELTHAEWNARDPRRLAETLAGRPVPPGPDLCERLSRGRRPCRRGVQLRAPPQPDVDALGAGAERARGWSR